MSAQLSDVRSLNRQNRPLLTNCQDKECALGAFRPHYPGMGGTLVVTHSPVLIHIAHPMPSNDPGCELSPGALGGSLEHI